MRNTFRCLTCVNCGLQFLDFGVQRMFEISQKCLIIPCKQRRASVALDWG